MTAATDFTLNLQDKWKLLGDQTQGLWNKLLDITSKLQIIESVIKILTNLFNFKS